MCKWSLPHTLVTGKSVCSCSFGLWSSCQQEGRGQRGNGELEVGEPPTCSQGARRGAGGGHAGSLGTGPLDTKLTVVTFTPSPVREGTVTTHTLPPFNKCTLMTHLLWAGTVPPVPGSSGSPQTSLLSQTFLPHSGKPAAWLQQAKSGGC